MAALASPRWWAAANRFYPLSSGAHLNPAVTFAMCFLAREPWIKLPIYTLAQTLGAFLGAGIVFGLYYGKHRQCCPSPRHSRSLSTCWRQARC